MKNYSINELPKVSVIVPCRNEKKYIAACLDTMIANSYPKDKIEILIVDGASEDGTKEIIRTYSEKYNYISIINNPKKNIPAAMNLGVKQANGDIIMKMDGHSTYEKDYIMKCVSYLIEYKADNVGGVWNVMPRGDSYATKAIARVLVEPLASGNAYIKIGADKPMWSDCVSFGCFRREVFETIGTFNELLLRGSDMDFNKRIMKNGGKILLVPEIKNNYYCDADFISFWKHVYSDGVWTTHVIKYGSRAFSFRHLVPMFFVASLIFSPLLALFYTPSFWLFIISLGSYLLAVSFVSLKMFITGKDKNIRYLYLFPWAFFVRHFSHGFGALYGFVKPKK